MEYRTKTRDLILYIILVRDIMQIEKQLTRNVDCACGLIFSPHECIPALYRVNEYLPPTYMYTYLHIPTGNQ